MSNKRRGRESKYTDAFKRQLVGKSYIAGATVPMVSRLHEVPTSRIYYWRGDARYQPADGVMPDFTSVEVADAPVADHVAEEIAPRRSDAHIEITFENGRRISVSDGVDVGFVVELAQGLAA